MKELQAIIENTWDNRELLQQQDAQDAVKSVVALLND
jgi:hypothetical protein